MKRTCLQVFVKVMQTVSKNLIDKNFPETTGN